MRMRKSVPKILVHRKLVSNLLRIRLRNAQSINGRKAESAVMDDFTTSVTYALSCLKSGGMKLKEKQLEAMKAIYDGNDVFLWLPTGYG